MAKRKTDKRTGNDIQNIAQQTKDRVVFCRSLFVFFVFLAIVLYVLHSFTASDYSFGFFKLSAAWRYVKVKENRNVNKKCLNCNSNITYLHYLCNTRLTYLICSTHYIKNKTEINILSIRYFLFIINLLPTIMTYVILCFDILVLSTCNIYNGIS